MMRDYIPAELINIAAMFQPEARESIQALLAQLWDTGGNGVSLTGQEAEKMSNIPTHPALWQHLRRVGVQGTRSFID